MRTTPLVRDGRPGSSGSIASGFAAPGQFVFLAANSGVDGYERWKCDGRTAVVAADIFPGSGRANPASLAAVGGPLLSAASDMRYGRERWVRNLDVEPPASTYSIQRLASGAAEEGMGLRFRIRRTGDTTSAGSVDIRTFSAGAISGIDFRTLRQRLTFKPGQVFRDVSVETLQDYAVESSERFRLSLRTVHAADRLGVASASGVILNKPLAYVGLDPSGAPFQVRDVPFDPTWAVRFSLNRDTLNPALPTYVYVHGWRDNATSENSQLVFDALRTAAANVLLVDWSGMAAIESIFQPTQAVTATQQVGETIADFLIKTGLPLASLTLIGHSLGSLVAASAAREIRSRTGQLISELVALDTASGFNYDIDARTRKTEAPLTFNTGLATTTTSFTVSDLIGGIPTVAGDNERAATADHAYLVQYARSRDLPGLSPDLVFANPVEHAAGLHNGVIGVYADLFRKRALDPGTIPLRQTFNASGKPDPEGRFDGVVVAPLPWSYPPDQTPVHRAPRAMGWASSYDNPMIVGSNVDDVLFFDLFRDERDTAFLVGRAGNDWLIADQTDNQGIDVLTGGRGADQFWFGYERYGQKTLPYTNTLAEPSGYGGNAYAVITDFNRKTDAITFGWKSDQIKARQGSAISGELVRLHGDGTAFMRRKDLIAYVPGLNVTRVPGLEAGGRLGYGQFAPLDEVLFFASASS